MCISVAPISHIEETSDKCPECCSSNNVCAAEIPRSLAIEELDKLAHDLNLNYQTFPSVETAYLEAKNQAEANDFIYIGGSTFVIAEIL